MAKLTVKQVNSLKLNALLYEAWREDWTVTFNPIPEELDRIIISVSIGDLHASSSGEPQQTLKWLRKAMIKLITQRNAQERIAKEIRNKEPNDD
jgi:hypothetical protein